MGERRLFQTIFLDKFMDQDTRNLENHVPDVNPVVGATWVIDQSSDAPTPVATVDIFSNQMRFQDQGDGSTRFVRIDMGEADGQMRLLCFVGNSINPAWPSLMFRTVVSGNSGFLLRQNAEDDQAQIIRPSSDQNFFIVESEALVSGANDKLLLEATFVGDQIDCHILNITTGAEAYLHQHRLVALSLCR